MEDALVEAQRSLAVLYQDTYPCTSRVQRCLREILNHRYHGSHRQFTDNFLRPTIGLLGRLKEKGFPLVKNGKVVVHLLAPSNHLEAGEMFYQVGHTTPGTFALKFAKYQGNAIIMQPSTIEEREFHLGFTQQYIKQLRDEASRFGHQLMRILLVSISKTEYEFAIEKVEVARIMPHSFENSFVVEAVRDQLPYERGSSARAAIGRKPEEHSSGTGESNPAYPHVMQAVKGETATPSGHHPVEHSLAPVESNPAYPPIHEAVKNNATTLDTDNQTISSCSAANRSNPGYPSIEQAVRDPPTAPETVRPPAPYHSSGASGSNTAYLPAHQVVRDVCNAGKQSKDLTSDTADSNPAYPSIHQAVKENTRVTVGRQTSEQSSGYSNPTYPPIHQAVKDDTTAPDSDRQTESYLSGTKSSNPAYPPVHQAVKDDTNVHDKHTKHPADASESNPAYPLIHQAVKDNSVNSPPPVFQTGNHSLGASFSNSAYPSIHQAVQDGIPAPDTGHQMGGHSSGVSVSNPGYPSIHEAAKDDKTAPDTDLQTSATGSNPGYPSIHQAVKDDVTASDTGHKLDKTFSCASGSNPAYPSIHQAVKDDVTASDTGHKLDKTFSSACSRNLAYPSINQAVKDDGKTLDLSYQTKNDVAVASDSNQSYPSIHQAVLDHKKSSPDTALQYEGYSLGISTSNPAYPSIQRSVKDDTIMPVTGHQTEGHPSGPGNSNPSYLPSNQAIREDTLTPAAIAHQGSSGSNSPYLPSTGRSEYASCRSSGINPGYLLSNQAIREDTPTPAAIAHQGTSGASTSNSPHLPSTGIRSEYASSRSSGSNLAYPPIQQAAKNGFTAPATCTQPVSSSDASNPPYSVNVNPTPSVTDVNPYTFLEDDEQCLF